MAAEILKEIKVLKHEERTLLSISSKISDQLNRLKVEELNLMSDMRGKSVASSLASPLGSPSVAQTTRPASPVQAGDEKVDEEEMVIQELDLVTSRYATHHQVIETEVEEEDEEHDDLTVFMDQACS